MTRPDLDALAERLAGAHGERCVFPLGEPCECNRRARHAAIRLAIDDLAVAHNAVIDRLTVQYANEVRRLERKLAEKDAVQPGLNHLATFLEASGTHLAFHSDSSAARQP